jgi:hypothetical protein
VAPEVHSPWPSMPRQLSAPCPPADRSAPLPGRPAGGMQATLPNSSGRNARFVRRASIAFAGAAIVIGAAIPAAERIHTAAPAILAATALLGFVGLVLVHRRHGPDLAMLAIAGSLLWFSLGELALGMQPAWIRANKGLAVRIQGIGAGILVLPLAGVAGLHVLLRGRMARPNALDWVQVGLVILALITMLTGFMLENDSTYVLGDTYRLLLTPAIYWACVGFMTTERQRRFVWKSMAVVGSFIAVLGMVAQFRKFATEWPYVLGKGTDVFVLAVAVLTYTSTPMKSTKRLAALAVAVLTISAIVSLERRYWLAPIAVWVLAIILEKGLARQRLVRLALTGCGLLGVAILLLKLLLPDIWTLTAAQVSRRYDYTFGGQGLDSSSARRFSEIEYMTAEFKHTSPLYFLIGLGQGAEFHDPDFLRQGVGSQPGLVHNIHNSYAGVFFRSGLLGLVAVGAFALLTVRLAARCVRQAQREQAWPGQTIYLKAALMSLIVAYAVDWNISSSLGNIPLAIIVGLLASMDRSARPGNEPGLMGGAV